LDNQTKSSSVQYEVLHPRGTIPPATLTPLVDRVPDLDKKLVYIVNTRKPHAEETLRGVEKLLRERYPSIDVYYIMKKTSYRDNEPELWDDVAAKADAAIVGPGD